MSAEAVTDFIHSLDKHADEFDSSQAVEILRFVNTLYAVVERHPKGCVIVHIPSGDAISFASFKRIFNTCWIKCVEKLHGVHGHYTMNVGDRWLKWKCRHQVETLGDLKREG